MCQVSLGNNKEASVAVRTQRKEEVGEGFLGFSSLLCKTSRIIIISESCCEDEVGTYKAIGRVPDQYAPHEHRILEKGPRDACPISAAGGQ